MMIGVHGYELLQLASLEDGVQKEQRSNFLEIGKLLTEILDSDLYSLKGYKSFVKYIDDEPVFKFTGKHAVRLVRTYRFIRSLPEGVSVPTSERQVRPLIKLSFDEARQVWIEAQRRARAEGKPVTGELVSELVSKFQREHPQDSSSQRRGRLPRWSQLAPANAYPLSSCASNGQDVSGSGCLSGVSAVLMLAEFERLRSKVNELPVEQKERILLEWRNALEHDLTREDEGSGSDQLPGLKRKQEVALHDAYFYEPRCQISRTSSSSSHKGHGYPELPAFGCKRPRTGKRKPRSDMSSLLLAESLEESVHRAEERQPSVDMTGLAFACGDKNTGSHSAKGMKLLWTAREILA